MKTQNHTFNSAFGTPHSAFQKLVLIGNYASDGQQSMQRFTRMLADGFTARGIEVETWNPQPHFSKLSPGGYRYAGIAKYLGYLDKFARFPLQLRHRAQMQPPGTVYHITDHANAMYARHLGGAPVVVTIHDLLQIRSALGEFPQNRLSRAGMKYQHWILKHLRALRAAVCISQKTRDDFLRLCAPSAPDTTSIIEMGLSHQYHPMPATEAAPLLQNALARHRVTPSALFPQSAAIIREAASTPAPFFIHVGGAQWYKNRSGLISIFAALRNIAATSQHKLLVIGPEFDATQRAYIAQHNLSEAIIRLPEIGNEELNAAYALAQALIFPSWEEGFGWPIAEAQACGCPVFTSNRSPMTEVGEDAAAYFDPANPTAAAALLAQTLSRHLSEYQLRADARAHAARWNPKTMLDAYEEVYSETLAQTLPSGAAQKITTPINLYS